MPRLIMRCRRTSPTMAESRGFMRRTCEPIGDLRPLGSSPNMKALLRFGSAPSSGLSLSEASASGAPLGQRPTILGGQPLLLGAVFGKLTQVLAEGCHARVQLAEDCVSAVEAAAHRAAVWGRCCGSRPCTPGRTRRP